MYISNKLAYSTTLFNTPPVTEVLHENDLACQKGQKYPEKEQLGICINFDQIAEIPAFPENSEKCQFPIPSTGVCEFNLNRVAY